MLNVIVPWTIG